MARYFDRLGDPITILEWGALHADAEYRILQKTKVFDVEVSTVWLGIDHGGTFAKPIIFETMVFRVEGEDPDCTRYSSFKEAMQGHMEISARLIKEFAIFGDC